MKIPAVFVVSLQRGIRLVTPPAIEDRAANLLAELSGPVGRRRETFVGLAGRFLFR
jgi:hypothetical protein